MARTSWSSARGAAAGRGGSTVGPPLVPRSSANQPVTVHGLSRSPSRKPHSWFFVDAKDAAGKVEKWSFEASTPTSLIRSGVKPGFVKAGDEVTIKGYRARDLSQNAGAARELVLADGRAFAVGPSVGPGR